MIGRAMLSFELDPDGDWIAHLECGHARHVRHRPPVESNPWIEVPAERDARINHRIECERCVRREWPEGFEVYKSTPEFDPASVPAGLRAEHRTRPGVWAWLEVLGGSVDLCFAAPCEPRVHVGVGERAAIPPAVTHHVEPSDDARFLVHFCRRAAKTAETASV